MGKPSDTLLQQLLSNTPIILFATDREGRILVSEGGLLEAIGRKPGEVVGRSAFNQFTDVPWVIASIHRVLGGNEHTVIGQLNERWLEVRYTPLREDSGEVVGMVGFAVDISP